MNKKILIISIIAVLIILIGGIVMVSGKDATAILNVDQGTVQVDQGNGFVNAISGMELSENDVIKTAENSKASLILFGSSIVILEENTEIELSELSKEHSKISQNSGTTWNKFSKMTGLESLEVETPNAVATVRGTMFKVGMFDISVTEGKVAVTSAEGKVYEIVKGEIIDTETFEKRAMTQEELNQAIKILQEQITQYKELRQNLLDNNKMIVGTVKKLNKITDEDIKKGIRDIDAGTLDINELIEKAFYVPNNVDKFVGFCDEIKILQNAIKDLKSNLPVVVEE